MNGFFSKLTACGGNALAMPILALTAAYYLTGQLGTLLAVPPGYATAIWPPSGIALAAVLIYGYRIWPGIVLGSFLVNLSISMNAAVPQDLTVSVAIAMGIACGAALQAVAGAYLVERFAAFPNPLATEKTVFLFLFFGGIVGSLINSTLSVSLLTVAGRIPPVGFPVNWGTWWLGDALGVFIFTPPVLAWLQRPESIWHNRRLVVWLPIASMFVLTTVLVYYESQNAAKQLRLELEQETLEMTSTLEAKLTSHINALYSLESFYLASATVDRENFRIFSSYLLEKLSGIRALSWNPVIPFSERASFEVVMTHENGHDYRITEQGADNRLVTAGKQPVYVPVAFIEPLSGNETAMGFDTYSSESRRDALEKARDSGKIAMTAKLLLVQEQAKQYSVLIIFPVYRSGMPHLTEEQRRKNIAGFFVAVLNLDEIFASAVKELNHDKLSYRLIDLNAPIEERILFANDLEAASSFVLQEKGLFGRNFSPVSEALFPTGGRQWQLSVMPTQAYYAAHRSGHAWLILLGGLTLTAIVGAFAMVASGRGAMLMELVEQRTALLERREDRLRETFESAPIGVATMSLDGRFLDVNRAYCEFIGYSRDELLSMNCRQVTHPDYHQADADLIERVLNGEMPGFTINKQYVRKNGESVWGNLSVHLIRYPDGLADHFVAVVENIQGRKQAEMQTAKTLSLLYATLDSTDDAILAVDLNNTWVVHNQRFIDLWSIPDEIIQSKDDSAALTFVLRQVDDSKFFLQRVQELYDSPEDSSFETMHLKNGKVIERFSMPQRIGGEVVGRVWSFRDVTDRVHAEESSHRESEKNLALLRNASDGIHILDYDGNIIEASDSFCAMLGYDREDVIGMNVVQWDASFSPEQCIVKVREQFEKPVRALFETKHRRKDGTVFDVEVSGFPLELDGKPVLFNSSRDISERKQTEAELRKLSLAVEQSPNSVVITDLDATIEYVNETFVRITGYSREEAIGQNPRILHSGKTDQQTFQDMWATLTDGKVWRGELVNKKKNDEEYTESVLISPVRQQDGNITHYVGVKEDITERKLAEARLQESEKRFRMVADAAPVLIWLAGPDSFCTWFNQGWLDFTGRGLEQELGNGWADNIYPDDFRRCLASYINHFERREPFMIEFRLRRYDGEYRWMHNSGVPRFEADGSFLGFIGSCIDISDRKLAEQKLAVQNLRYQTLLKSSTDAIHIVDLKGDIVDVNEAFCRQLGFTYAEALALNITQFEVPWADQDVLPTLRELIYSGAPKQLERQYRRKDGRIFDVEINAVQVVLEGQPLLFASARDITERKQNEAVILAAKNQAEALARSKSEFLANMSHEIWTPMNAIIGLTHLALNKDVSPDIRDYLEKINSSSNSLMNILNDILDYSKLEAGRLTINNTPFDLEFILDNINKLFADNAMEKGLDFVVAAEPDVPRNLIGDYLRLQQVLINLVSNAIKFTENGKVELKISALQIEQSQAKLCFCVTDTGIGMSDEDRRKLFQPFSQVDGSITRRFGGTGLGLVISHNLLHMMGGEFAVESTAGRGSSFSFELVLGISAVPHSQKLEQKPGMLVPEQPDSQKVLTGARVLVAEDNSINQQVVKEFLSLSGMIVEVAGNGKEALALLDKRLFDAVLMDAHMPEMDGYEATQKIRAQARFDSLPVIALTAGVTKEEQQKCMDSGMNDFVPKPINPKQLIATLLKWLNVTGEPAKEGETIQASLLGVEDMPGFELDNLLVMLGNNQDLAAQLLLTFMESMLGLPEQIEAKLTGGDYSAAKELVHKVKGASGNIGAVRLFAASELLESELKQGGRVNSFKVFREAFEDAISVIAKDYAVETPPLPQSEGNREQLKRIAVELDILLKENDFISESLLNTLKSHLATGQYELFLRLRKLINDLQYNEARKVLNWLAGLSDTDN